ncbi:hypothetical protein G7067_03530 [Leucobacter insecticola]|uniref:DUF3137 domain-containing protein n=1 Tax=Leucobacter insecticola TaxID=2714934 RepID=A0A6G8FH67_9MICO|nr:hypothetical protein [Leucobacter insecticola]QIM15697.1 hypothetical protein G7067_03530 [Leucobacter insecticola]
MPKNMPARDVPAKPGAPLRSVLAPGLVVVAGFAVLLLSLRLQQNGGGPVGLVLGAVAALLCVALGVLGIWREIASRRGHVGPAETRAGQGAPERTPASAERGAPAGPGPSPETLKFLNSRFAKDNLMRTPNWVLALVAIASVWPETMSAVVAFAVFGVVLGAILYARRPRKQSRRGIYIMWLPPILTCLFCGLLWELPTLLAPLVIPAATAIGIWIVQKRERLTGPPLRLVQSDWDGVDVVGAGAMNFDVRALWTPVSRRQRREFRRDHPDVRNQAMRARVIAVNVVAWLMPIGFLALATGVSQEIRGGADNMVSQLLGMASFLTLMLLGWGILIWWGLRASTRITKAEDHIRYLRFAQANGLIYDPGPRTLAAGLGVLTRILRGGADDSVVFANREASGGGERESNSYFGGVCRVKLPVTLPNLVLRSRRNSAPTFSAYTRPAPSQRLSLEGDFDRHFSLFCPRGYETDALYLFTPDVMAWLIDDAGDFDVELVDDTIVLRSRDDLVSRDPAKWARIALALHALDDRIMQWSRWRDDREDAHRDTARLAMEDPGERPLVGASGRRVRLSLGFGGVFVGLFGALYLTLLVLSNSV